MFKNSKDKVRNLRAVPDTGASEAEVSESTAVDVASDADNIAGPTSEEPGQAIQLDELTEICRVAWCETFYRLAEGFSFKDDFVKEHLAPFMQQAGVDPETLSDDDRAKALITFASYIVCAGLAKPLESAGLSKEEPQLYSQALYQTVTQGAQQAFVSIVDEWSFRTPLLPFINVFSQAVYKQELEDLAIAYLFGPAYEITLRKALFFNKWIILPDSSDEAPDAEATTDEEPEGE